VQCERVPDGATATPMSGASRVLAGVPVTKVSAATGVSPAATPRVNGSCARRVIRGKGEGVKCAR
jgi:hypothetical protein